MYKLSIVLGWSVIRMQLQNPFWAEHGAIWAKIKQHRIILSDNIDKYYLDNAEKEGLATEYRDFISSISSSDVYQEIGDQSNDLSKNLADYLKNKSKTIAVVICEKEDSITISKSSCRNQYTIEEADEDENGPFSIYSVKAAFYVDSDENALPYIEWLKNLISEEKEINIIDPYVLDSERNYKCLKDYYFPIIPRGCKVNLHVPNNSALADRIVKDAEENNINIEIFRYPEMGHERFITTSNVIVSIGVGIDFMREKQGKTVMRKGSNFTLRRKDRKLQYMEEEKKLAGAHS